MAEKATTRGAKHKQGVSLFPMFVKLAGRNCLVVGAGSVGEGKIRSLLEAGAKVRVVAPQASAAVREWAQAGEIAWEPREFKPSDLDGIFLVVAATSSSDLNGLIFGEAQKRHVLCNAVDDPEHCDFYYGAVVRRGDLQIAISTAGKSPALAQRLREELEARYGPEFAQLVEELGEARRELFASQLDAEERRRRLHELANGKAAAASKGAGR
ncbi:MAG TPA: bifunctional precorrin-2 dehydrogenase/sirohydrochlorin ferrochelatase [Terriglobales bacterium]|nr:bifunctional precorrin-2 dehydrogenase/sirohydrochlorin ferrochelatase [Terriglobales bacterium]